GRPPATAQSDSELLRHSGARRPFDAGHRWRPAREYLRSPPVLKHVIARVLAWRGYSVVRRPVSSENSETDPDLDREFLELYNRCAQFTATSVERMYALRQAA